MAFEVLVVDNASFDGCDQILKEEYPSAIFIQSKENIGFAKANNLGFKHSSGRNLLFLNPDTKIVGPAINTLFNNLEKIVDAGSVGGKLLNSDLSIQTSCVQPFPTVLNQALDIDILKLRFPKLKLWGIQALFFNNGTPTVVDAISGACIMIKREIFERIGLFNTNYFMYAEDIDLCYKVWQAGYKTYFINDAQIIHHGGGSTAKHHINYLNSVLKRESIFRFLQTNKGQLTAQLYRASTIFISLTRMMLIALLIISIYSKDDRVNSLHDTFNKWKKIMRWSLGLERWALSFNNKNNL